ncbi:MAG: OmpH family outer membrane protein [Bacteroides sp.]|nr:OmpH family outer membrane protein [Bacteroides sp.]MDE6422995.1 OmpH family outer membrane protein [Muribaculaceae bacterium]
MFKKILLVAALLIPMLASAQTLKVGLVDLNEIITKMPETADAEKQVGDASKKYEDEFAKLQDEMKRRLDEYQTMKEDELPAIKERKAREIQDYQTKIEQFSQEAMQHLQQMNQQLMTPVIQKVRTAIESVGKEGGYSLIQDKNPQLTYYFASPVVDITDDVKAKLGVK